MTVDNGELTFAVGAVVRFIESPDEWLVRANTPDGRYSLATAEIDGEANYTIIDHVVGVRGPMDIVGGGLDIFTTDGDDPAIDAAIEMLQSGDWGISRRYGIRTRVAG